MLAGFARYSLEMLPFLRKTLERSKNSKFSLTNCDICFSQNKAKTSQLQKQLMEFADKNFSEKYHSAILALETIQKKLDDMQQAAAEFDTNSPNSLKNINKLHLDILTVSEEMLNFNAMQEKNFDEILKNVSNKLKEQQLTPEQEKLIQLKHKEAQARRKALLAKRARQAQQKLENQRNSGQQHEDSGPRSTILAEKQRERSRSRSPIATDLGDDIKQQQDNSPRPRRRPHSPKPSR